jgi:hypothetical protein
MSFEFCDGHLNHYENNISEGRLPINEDTFFAAAKCVQRRGKLQGNISLFGPQ